VKALVQTPAVQDPALAGLPVHLRETAGRILAVIVTSHRGLDEGWTAGDLAARLGIRPRSAERDEMQSALRMMGKVRPKLVVYDWYGDGRRQDVH